MDLSASRLLAMVVSLALCCCFGAPCLASSLSLVPKFNCKKIAFYKTHKTGSTTLGGIIFRVAVSTNMSMYTARSHYLQIHKKENQQLMGRSDVVLRHISFSDSPGFHMSTRSFYSRVLGTAEYGFLTVLRHPVDRYISDFYYFQEPDARLRHKMLTLSDYVAEGKGANRMAGEFAIRNVRTAMEFVAGEMQSEGMFLPLELLDYGLALLATHCGWRMSQIMYLTSNSNTAGKERYGKVRLRGRPTVAQLSEEDPDLVDRIAAINSLDAVLYSAAVSQLLARLQPSGPSAAAASAVMSAAVRLMVARKQLEVECRALRSGSGLPSLATQAPISADDMAGLCAWYEVLDLVYEYLPSNLTGRVDIGQHLSSPELPSASWPVGHLVRLADGHLASYDDLSVPYYHSLLAVHVRPSANADAELVYGITGGGAEEPLAAAVRLWSMHHAGEGLHHLVFFVDAANEAQHEQIVRRGVTAALGDAGSPASSYTSFSIIRCSSPDNGGAATAGGCDSEAGFQDLVGRSRWSAVLPGLAHFLYGTRGSVRSVLLSYEALLHSAGAVCAPLVHWQTAPLELSGGGGGSGQAACLRVPCSLTAADSLPCVMIQGLPLLGGTRTYSSTGEALDTGNMTYSVPHNGPGQQRLEVALLTAAGSPGDGEEGGAPCFPGPRPRLSVPWCG